MAKSPESGLLLLTATCGMLLLLCGRVSEAAPGYGGGYGGHVSIKVYRGPSHGHGYHSFAPFGYHVHLPPDNHGYHG
ncbi:hypothetical protein MRX96_025437 [Rhipicephalus microplus]|nr:uncharacterized protein LOC119175567 isoform X2 [Rhipicephalus microplus]